MSLSVTTENFWDVIALIKFTTKPMLMLLGNILKVDLFNAVLLTTEFMVLILKITFIIEMVLMAIGNNLMVFLLISLLVEMVKSGESTDKEMSTSELVDTLVKHGNKFQVLLDK